MVGNSFQALRQFHNVCHQHSAETESRFFDPERAPCGGEGKDEYGRTSKILAD
ncbi:hypothetical protein KIN20_009455 [Parelaphostrongylus tenuis]|uniref:Uncharacterized protein n=1 Tax=Parelaphostrongylus tenuis TaxID=148309 RepID=A0AAD5MP33_PARTN|nr:hypothetical protein KIN20_009455 [Parelaphostrongylus tenuis]